MLYVDHSAFSNRSKVEILDKVILSRLTFTVGPGVSLWANTSPRASLQLTRCIVLAWELVTRVRV